MKYNQEEIILHIDRAIKACKEDYVFSEVKTLLLRALRLTESVKQKRNARENQSKNYAEQAKKNNEKWMEMLKNGLKYKELQKESEDDQRSDD
jgi:FKBP-type peptidyl-prolyl cis-trans isomerase